MNDITDLLDMTLDDIDDLPEFTILPAGVHRCYLSLAIKDINGNQCIEAELKLIEHLELAGADEELKEGSLSSTIYMLNNEFGLMKFKKMVKPIAENLGVTRLSDVVEQAKDIEVVIVTSQRKDKKDPDKVYLNIKTLEVV